MDTCTRMSLPSTQLFMDKGALLKAAKFGQLCTQEGIKFQNQEALSENALLAALYFSKSTSAEVPPLIFTVKSCQELSLLNGH